MKEKKNMKPPSGACDCHVHFFGEPSRYPLAPTTPYVPPVRTVEHYRPVMKRLGLERVVIVQPTGYGSDNRCTMDSVAALDGAARSVVIVTPTTPLDEIARLDAAGARGARFYLLRGTTVSWDMVEAVAHRVADFGWHVQMQFDGKEIPERAAFLSKLPCPVVIDHIGKFLDPVLPGDPAVQALCRLLETGKFWVKLSEPYVTSKTGGPIYEDVGAIARVMVKVNPERLVWASNWPHGDYKNVPTEETLLDLIWQWVPDEQQRHRVLVDNPALLYRFDKELGAASK